MNHNPEWCTLPADHVGPCDFGVGPLGDRRACPHAFGSLLCLECLAAANPLSVQSQTVQLLRLEKIVARFQFRGAARLVGLHADVRRSKDGVAFTLTMRVPSADVVDQPPLVPIATRHEMHVVQLQGMGDDDVINMLAHFVHGFLSHEIRESVRIDDGRFVLGDPHKGER